MQGQLGALFVQHFRDGLIQRRYQMFALGVQLLPAHPHLRPQQRGEQEAGRDRLAQLHAGIGAGQRLGDEGFVRLEERVQQRQDAVVQPLVTQSLQAGQAMAAFQ